MVTQVDTTSRIPWKDTSRQVNLPVILGLFKALDITIICGTALAIYYAYVDRGRVADSNLYFVSILASLLITGLVFSKFELYQEKTVLAGNDGIRRVWSAWAVAIGLFLAIAFGLKISDHFSRVWFTTWALSGAFGLAVSRAGLHYLVGRWTREGLLAARTVIVGAGPHGARLARYLTENTDIQTRIIGFVDDRAGRTPSVVEGFAVLGNTQALERMVRRGEVDDIIIALPWSAEHRLRDLTHRLAQLPVRIRLAPDLAGFNFTQTQFSFMAGLPMLNVFERPISGWSSIVKSAEDRFVSALTLVVLTPVLAAIALAIKLDSPGPVLFRQKRHGFNHRLIEVFKFRTMYADRTDPNCAVQTVKDDPRVTKVGRFLRSTSLDELPQLLNVLKGDMSLVGPRPHAVETKAAGRLFEEIVEDYAARHNVKPGITGWAQVNGWRGETNTEEKIQRRVEHDLYYIENWSLWLDVKIILRTLFIVLKGENAY